MYLQSDQLETERGKYIKSYLTVPIHTKNYSTRQTWYTGKNMQKILYKPRNNFSNNSSYCNNYVKLSKVDQKTHSFLRALATVQENYNYQSNN